jgi:hypothetical protein
MRAGPTRRGPHRINSPLSDVPCGQGKDQKWRLDQAVGGGVNDAITGETPAKTPQALWLPGSAPATRPTARRDPLPRFVQRPQQGLRAYSWCRRRHTQAEFRSGPCSIFPRIWKIWDSVICAVIAYNLFRAAGGPGRRGNYAKARTTTIRARLISIPPAGTPRRPKPCTYPRTPAAASNNSRSRAPVRTVDADVRS